MYDDDVTKRWHFRCTFVAFKNRTHTNWLTFSKNFISFFLVVAAVAVSHSADSSSSICCEMYTVNEMRRNTQKIGGEEKNEAVEHVLLAINATIRCGCGAHKKIAISQIIESKCYQRATERGQCWVCVCCVCERTVGHKCLVTIACVWAAAAVGRQRVTTNSWNSIFFGQQFFAIGKNMNGSASGAKNVESNDDK